MAIADVVRLKNLRKRLVSLEWQLPKILDAIQFSYFSENCHNYYELRTSEVQLLLSVIQPRGRDNLSQSAGNALKEIVLQRFDIAIKLAAKEARDEAQSVLDVLEET